ncbi:MAG: carbohydrate kinase family protein [Sphaerochaeta sp.]
MNFIAFGEVLFDVFEDKKKLGGAPMNVAGHLSQMGASSAIISGVGDDEFGKEALEGIRSINVDTKYISIVDKETGVANVTLTSKGIPTYDFNKDNAFDNIPMKDYSIDDCDIFYFGSLSQRNDHNVEVLKSILDKENNAIKFFDINIRKKYYQKDFIKYGFEKCNILKVNDEEVPIVAEIIGCDESESTVVAKLQKDYNIEIVLVTKGKLGTTLYSGDLVLNQGINDVKVVDTVGAGDSFSAGFLNSYFNKDSLKEALKRGSLLADYVVTQSGAIPSYSDEVKKALDI